MIEVTKQLRTETGHRLLDYGQHYVHLLTNVRGGPFDGEGLLIGVDKTSVPFSCMSKGAYFNGQYRKGVWHSL